VSHGTRTVVRLEIVPVTFRDACAFIATHHRHHKPPVGMKFAIGVARADSGGLVGVATVGRPVARSFDDGLTLETQAGESGSSLRAAGWAVLAERPARGSWADSSVLLRDLRDPVGAGGVQRTLWAAA
jgi:hypothetical protein